MGRWVPCYTPPGTSRHLTVGVLLRSCHPAAHAWQLEQQYRTSRMVISALLEVLLRGVRVVILDFRKDLGMTVLTVLEV